MRDGWRRVDLAEVLRPAGQPVAVGSVGEVPYAGVHWYGSGVYRRMSVDATTVKAATLTRIRAGQVVYNRMWATRGSFGVAEVDVEGCLVTNDFPVFDAVGGVEPRYLALWFQTPAFQSAAASSAVGTTERRRLHERDFLRLTIDLPSLTEQRRIVDLIGSVDLTHEQARKTLTSVELTQRAVLLDLFGREPVVWVPLVEVLEDLIGGVWGRPPGEDEVDVAALGLTAFNAPTARVDRDHSTPRSVNRERWSRRGLRAGDIILERSGGTNDRPVGRVIAAQADMLDVVPTDFMRLLRVDPSRAVPRYVFWWLWVRYQRGDTLAFQSKTTNIRNLRVTDYLALPLPMSSRDVQSRVVAVAEELAALTEAALGVVDRLARVRSALLADLLSGEHEIPASYDRFLDGVA